MKFNSAEEAEKVIIEYGGSIADDKIYRPEDLKFFSKDDWIRFFDAYDYLRKEHGYDSDADDIIAYIDF